MQTRTLITREEAEILVDEEIENYIQATMIYHSPLGKAMREE